MFKYQLPLYENRTALIEIAEYLPLLTTITEIIFNIFGKIVLIFVIIQFYKIKTFHLNLRILLIDTMASYLLRTVSRTAVCIFVVANIRNLNNIGKIFIKMFLKFSQ